MAPDPGRHLEVDVNACRSNACGQGRTACPCPDACRISEPEPIKQFDAVDDAVLLFGLAALVCLLIALGVFIARNPYLFANLFF